MEKFIQYQTNPCALTDSIICENNYRITILTDCLIRFEYDKTKEFRDCATKTVLNRNFPKPHFVVNDKIDSLEIITDSIHVKYDKKEFSTNGLEVCLVGNAASHHHVWHYGEKFRTLGGTARTLDCANGRIPVELGILSRDGFSILDDTGTPEFLSDGWFKSGDSEQIDFYFFGYGFDYYQALKDFYHLTGSQPILPRFALGSWWSRYYPYSQQEYKELMLRFKQEKIPFSVAVIDMDWHLTKIPSEYGNGWTGFSWNKELFPNPKEFLSWLHENDLRITLNLHPADGVRPHETSYPQMLKAYCKQTGKSSSEFAKGIPFAPESQEFMSTYFSEVLEPLEKEGVDFWWVDWQQGEVSRVKGLDPLWVLNHYHYMDSKKKHGIGLTFSRYSGPGSHRYPIGFSGDTVISWESLDFQSEFTATASNIGYGWWSHDIGGHMLGKKDDELALRWLQLGVFSPIMRLHSSCNVFNGKEPWRYSLEVNSIMKTFLQLRHRLVPYLYSMNLVANKENVPLVRPLYYEYPTTDETYSFPNEYFFGSELLVCPITQPQNPSLHRAKVEAWLPSGLWYDVFSGIMYDGGKNGRKLTLWRPLSEIPPFVKAGTILVLGTQNSAESCSSVETLPETLEIHVFSGSNCSFTLHEGSFDTVFKYTEKNPVSNEDFRTTLLECDGNLKILRNNLVDEVSFKQEKLLKQRNYKVFIDQRPVPLNPENFIDDNFDSSFDRIVDFSKIELPSQQKLIYKRIYDFLNEAEIDFQLKDSIFYTISPVLEKGFLAKEKIKAIGQLETICEDRDLFSIIMELLTSI